MKEVPEMIRRPEQSGTLLLMSTFPGRRLKQIQVGRPGFEGLRHAGHLKGIVQD